MVDLVRKHFQESNVMFIHGNLSAFTVSLFVSVLSGSTGLFSDNYYCCFMDLFPQLGNF